MILSCQIDRLTICSRNARIPPYSEQYAAVAQSVERIHGKDEVSGSIPDGGSIPFKVCGMDSRSQG